ncbi:unnamed protein product [Linum trigynum]|uniref:Uncharacterized protein n=1 Tax=Linum trigynum TaxID=586398 RepID=A0AAV2DXY0_9ROSI
MYSAVDRDSAAHNLSIFHQCKSETFCFRTDSGFRTIVIEDYVTFRKAFVRISTEEVGRRKRFIYLETLKLCGLEKNLHEISRKGWDSKAIFQRKEPSRVIQIDRFACREGNFVKISERLACGTLSFITIPFVPSEWGGMIGRLCRPMSKISPRNHIMRRAWVVQGRSFADAVKLGFPMQLGESSIKLHNSQAFLDVEEKGVNDRLCFLDLCLTISFFKSRNQ